MITKKSDAGGWRSLLEKMRRVKEMKSERERRRRAWLSRAVEQVESRCLMSGDVIIAWNRAALQAELALNTDQGLATRNQAISSLAAFNAVNAIDRSFAGYHFNRRARRRASQEAAAAEASHDVLVALYPSKKGDFDALLSQQLSALPQDKALRAGIKIGR